MTGLVLLILIFLSVGVLITLTPDQDPRLNEGLLDKVDAKLPQTQCGQCGYNGCRPYAEAILLHQADINQCPPGGQKTIHKLARLLGRPVKPLNPDHGTSQPGQIARIDEARCIGCVKCIKACPVDAIIGAAKCMHTVIEAECTGCELCIEPCPVDCIDLVPLAHLQEEGVQYAS